MHLKKFNDRKKCYPTPAEVGHAFEERVKNAFERISYVLVQKNQWNKNYSPEKDNAKKREYDIVMFSTRENQFYIIECKAHYGPNTFVGVQQMEEFNHKLENYNGRSAKPVLVTDTDFTRTAKEYAYANKILMVNGWELNRIESSGSGFAQLFTRTLRSGISSGLEMLAEKLANNYFGGR